MDRVKGFNPITIEVERWGIDLNLQTKLYEVLDMAEQGRRSYDKVEGGKDLDTSKLQETKVPTPTPSPVTEPEPVIIEPDTSEGKSEDITTLEHIESLLESVLQECLLLKSSDTLAKFTYHITLAITHLDDLRLESVGGEGNVE